MKNRRILILNFNGIGNAIYSLALLKRLTEVAPGFTYYLTANAVYENATLMRSTIQRRPGSYPAHWRRCAPDDHSAIREFIARERIDTVISLRNEGPQRDTGYFVLKKAMEVEPVNFWDFYSATMSGLISAKASHIACIVELFRQHGIEIGDFHRTLLRDFIAQTARLRPTMREVGFVTGAGVEVKALSVGRWIELGRMILERSNYDVVVYAGSAASETARAMVIASEIESVAPGRCRCISGLSLEAFWRHLTGLSLAICNDSSGLHAAMALGVETVGLYFSTDARIWGGYDSGLHVLQSSAGLTCEWFKQDAGNCERYYAGCPAPCKEELTPARIFTKIAEVLKIPPKRVESSCPPPAPRMIKSSAL